MVRYDDYIEVEQSVKTWKAQVGWTVACRLSSCRISAGSCRIDRASLHYSDAWTFTLYRMETDTLDGWVSSLGFHQVILLSRECKLQEPILHRIIDLGGENLEGDGQV